MIRSFTKIATLVLIAAATFTACKKNNDSNDSLAVTKENLAGTYTLVSIKEKATNVPEQDNTGQYVETCEKDDEYVLKTDMSFAYNDAGTKCSSNGSYTDTWQLQDKTITFDQWYGTVSKLTSKELVVELTISMNNVTYTKTMSFAKK